MAVSGGQALLIVAGLANLHTNQVVHGLCVSAPRRPSIIDVSAEVNHTT